jgi:AcrR family transcriptional regulator
MKSTREYRMSARAAAAEQTHERILRAARQRFLAAPYDEVTLAEIATDSGVSTQTVLNRFATKENLFLEFMARFHDELGAIRAGARRGNVRSAVRVVLRQYELMGDANVSVLGLEHRLPALAQVSRTGRDRHRQWIEDVFGEQLPADPRARHTVVAAVYAATDVYVWKLLRRDLGNSLAETTRVMERLVRGALAPPHQEVTP